MSVSVAMASYNGEKYILEQMKSILDQTHLADEVVIRDDNSSDKTVELCNSFIEENGLRSRWSIVQNTCNLGFVENFLIAAEACTGDIIFFSDQDDIWEKQKIERMLEVFDKNPKAQLVSCNTTLIDSEGKPLNTFMTKFQNFGGGIKKYEFSEEIRLLKSSGLTLAFRRSILPEIAYFIRKYHLTYDVPFGLVCTVREGYYKINQILVFHRVHNTNTSNPQYGMKQRTLERHVDGQKFRVKHLEAFYSEYAYCLEPRTQKCLKKQICTMHKNIQNVMDRSLIKLIISFIKPSNMDNKLISFANILYTIRGR